jgi:CRP-like cAMP-binding protein
LQITCFVVLASGVPFLSASQGTGPKYWGFYILPWVAAILLPLFLLFSIGLAIFELYYEFTTTSGKGRPFRRLLASLRVPGERRTAADVRTIHKAFAETEFLQRYPVSMLLRLCRKCELLALKPDEAVFREGEVGHHFYVLIHGTVDVSVADVSDKSSPPRLKCLNSLHDSGSFGERALTEVRCSLTATAAGCVAAMGANRACRQPWLALAQVEGGGKRTASVICRTACKLIQIHRDAFQVMVEEDQHDVHKEVPASSALMTGSESDAEGPHVQGTSTQSCPDELQATVMASLAADKDRKSRKMYRAVSFLKSNFAKSMESRSDKYNVSHTPASDSRSTQLLERAVAARSTIVAWCDLVGVVSPTVATTTLSGQLTETQVRTPPRIVLGRLHVDLLQYSGSDRAGRRKHLDTGAILREQSQGDEAASRAANGRNASRCQCCGACVPRFRSASWEGQRSRSRCVRGAAAWLRE